MSSFSLWDLEYIHSCVGHLAVGLLHPNLQEAILQEYSEGPPTKECRGLAIGDPMVVHITSLLCELCWLPVCFHVPIKVFYITFKTESGMCPRYFTPIRLAHPTNSNGSGLLWTPSAKDSGWCCQGEQPFPLCPMGYVFSNSRSHRHWSNKNPNWKYENYF